MKNRTEIKEKINKVVERIKKAENLDEIKSIIKEEFPKDKEKLRNAIDQEQSARAASGDGWTFLTEDQVEKAAGGGHYAALTDGNKVWITLADGDEDYPDNEIYHNALFLESLAMTGCFNLDSLIGIAAELYDIPESLARKALNASGPAYLAEIIMSGGYI